MNIKYLILVDELYKFLDIYYVLTQEGDEERYKTRFQSWWKDTYIVRQAESHTRGNAILLGCGDNDVDAHRRGKMKSGKSSNGRPLSKNRTCFDHYLTIVGIEGYKNYLNRRCWGPGMKWWWRGYEMRKLSRREIQDMSWKH